MNYIYTPELYHHGILGQKWGVRRYQNSDGSLTDEGRIRYGRGNGSKKFLKDALNDLNSTRGRDEYRNRLKAWGKTAEESGVMDPNAWDSYYIGKRDQNRIMSDVYNNMPTVVKNKEEHAQAYRKNADGFRKEQIDLLDNTLNEFYPNLHEELGTKKGKETRNYLIDAVKGYNELDVDQVTFQRMDDLPDLLENGRIDIKTFNKYYDAQAAEDARDYLGYGIDADQFKSWNQGYQELKRQGRNFKGYDENMNHTSIIGEDYLKHSDIMDIPTVIVTNSDSELYHHGVKGQKWGHRRYQNSDGSLTDEGYAHWGLHPDGSKLKERGTRYSQHTHQQARRGTLAGVATGVALAAATIGSGGIGGLAIPLTATVGSMIGTAVGQAQTRRGQKKIKEILASGRTVKYSDIYKK